MKNKKILILGAGNAQIDLIKYCRLIGLETYGCSYTNTDKGIQLLDHFAQINITDVSAIEKYFNENQIDYIYSVGSDIAVPTFCKVSEATKKFSFISAKTAEICCNKQLMREVMQGSAYNLPYIVVSSIEEIDVACLFPAIIKPVDSQGQRGVYLVHDSRELKECFEKSVSYSRSGKVIIEKYVSGDEISVNAYMKDGEVMFAMMSDRESFQNLPGGIIKEHHIPSVYENTATSEKVKALVCETTKKLEIYNGPVYFQIKIAEGNPYLIEVTPRLDGCHMWKLIDRYCGVNLLELTMKHFLGEDIEIKEYEPSRYHMHLAFFSEPPETIFDEQKYEGYVWDEKVMYYQSGDVVRRLNGYMEKCGYRIYKSPYKVGVIGGSGFIGTHFQIQYSDRFRFVNIARKNGVVADYSVRQLEMALKGCDSAVILAAKMVNPKEVQTMQLYDDNINIVRNSLDACRNLGIKNVVFTSTRCVYKKNQKVPIAEEGEICPINFYGDSKLAAEQICIKYNEKYGMNVKILRLAQVFGLKEEQYMIGTFIKNALLGEPLTIYGEAKGERDYIYIKDVCNAIRISLEKYDKYGIYNVGSGKGVSAKELADTVIRGFQSASQCVIQKDKEEDVSVTYLDISKAGKELGFFCQFTLEEAVKDLKKLHNRSEA